MKKVEAYLDLNGNLHHTADEATEASIKPRLIRLLESNGVGYGGAWSAEMIARVLHENVGEIRDIVNIKESSND